jgi:hypothetical protein
MYAQVIYVDVSASGADDGSSWTDAFPDLQDALAIATSGDQVWVAEGNYYPTICSPCNSSDRSVAFELPSGVKLYGGFNGSETMLSDREPELHPTILSGDIGIPSDSIDNSYHVLTAAGTECSALLDHLIIEEANGDLSSLSSGGGILVENGACLSITNCLIRNNTVRWRGGGIEIDEGDLTVLNSTFEGNVAEQGGGLNAQATFDTASVILTNCDFYDNTATGAITEGAGVSISSVHTSTLMTSSITGCHFEGNRCTGSIQSGGGLYLVSVHTGSHHVFTLENCTFIQNSAEDGGGAHI